MRGRGFFEAGHVSARATRKAARNAARPRRRWRRFLSGVAWYLIPVVLVLSAAGYTYAALVIHVNPPVVAVRDSALRPTMRSGELVVLVPVHVDAVAKGELIAIRISSSARETYNLPATMIQRVVRIEHTLTGRVFITEARRGGLEFTTPASDVVGRPRYIVPLLGYVFDFATSVEGVIFFVALVVIWFLYYIFGVIDERRRRRRSFASEKRALSVTSNDVPPGLLKESLASLNEPTSPTSPDETLLHETDVASSSEPVPAIAEPGASDEFIDRTQAFGETNKKQESRPKDAKVDGSAKSGKKREKERKKEKKRKKLKKSG